MGQKAAEIWTAQMDSQTDRVKSDRLLDRCAATDGPTRMRHWYTPKTCCLSWMLRC